MVAKIFLFLSAVLIALSYSYAFTAHNYEPRTISMVSTAEPRAVTITEERTWQHVRKRRNAGRQWDSDPISGDEFDVDNSLEWLIIDESEISRDDTDPFHILLLNATYEKNKRITVEYVASSCSYVLNMPIKDAEDLASAAKNNGFSCLGTWTHEECMTLGGQLQQRDLVVRVVPYLKGSERFWQARDVSERGAGAIEDGAIGQSGGFE